MNKKEELSILIKNIEECSQSLAETNIQMQTLYGVIKSIKSSKDQETTIHVYKQAYDALGEHIRSFSNLIRVVREQVDNVEHPKREK